MAASPSKVLWSQTPINAETASNNLPAPDDKGEKSLERAIDHYLFYFLFCHIFQ